MHIPQKPENRKGNLSRMRSKPFRSFVYMLLGALSLRYGTRYFQALWIPPQTSNDLISDSAVYDTPKSPDSSSFAPRMSIQTMLLPFHDMLPSEDAFTRDPALSVILPITRTSMDSMENSLSLIHQEPGEVVECLLIAPSSLHGNIRHALRELLSSMDYHSHIDITVITWPPGLTEGSATLEAARHATSDRLLFLDSFGFADISANNRMALLNPPAVNLPLGPRARDASGNDFVCFHQAEDEEVLGYLVPPMVVPSDILLPAGPSANDSGPEFWASFADEIVRSRLDHDSGVVTGLISAAGQLCSSEHDHRILGPVLYHDDPSSDTTISQPDAEVHGAFAFVFANRDHLRHLNPIVCRLSGGGQVVQVLTPFLDQAQTLRDCGVQLVHIQEASSVDEMGTALSQWILQLPTLPDVVVTPLEDHALLTALDFVLKRYTGLGIVTVKIPSTDLPFCDWLGSLSLEEWRS